MKTITIQIGNSDNKLSQSAWSHFIHEMNAVVAEYATQVHFFGGSRFDASWQNVAWVCVAPPERSDALKQIVERVRVSYQQNSVAWTEGDTELV